MLKSIAKKQLARVLTRVGDKHRVSAEVAVVSSLAGMALSPAIEMLIDYEGGGTAKSFWRMEDEHCLVQHRLRCACSDAVRTYDALAYSLGGRG